MHVQLPLRVREGGQGVRDEEEKGMRERIRRAGDDE